MVVRPGAAKTRRQPVEEVAYNDGNEASVVPAVADEVGHVESRVAAEK
ncbi:MAG: hypothetical protein OXB92_10225 [Acidimicrobiaceae bacterium]|nr:hypothetical protein [Acidimicrobiia bacterium]MCY4494220.1 hypothetical protein [Acidimicrobiaceae bacterium]